jgi:hypothetical protein
LTDPTLRRATRNWRAYLPARSFIHSRTLIWTLISAGVLFRVAQYLSNPSIWQDEAFIALNLAHTPLSDLWEPLNNRQSAPVGFLLAQKGAVESLGTSEYALRLIPLLCSIASIFLFYAVSRYWALREAIPVGIGLFAVAVPLTIYAAQAKQYSVDVAAALALYLGVIWLRRARLSLQRAAVFAAIAALVVWLSHPSVFVLTAILIALVTTALVQRGRRSLAALSLALVVSTVSFGASYFVSRDQLSGVRQSFETSPSSDSASLRTSESVPETEELDAYAPFPPSRATVKWGGEKAAEIAHDALGSHRTLTGVLAIVLLVGAVSMFRRARETALILTLPIVFALIASAMELYPIGGRFVLFLVPPLILLIAEGTVAIIRDARGATIVLALLLAAVVLVPPAASAVSNLMNPWKRNEVRPLLEHLSDQAQRGDGLYMDYTIQYAMRYYWERGVLEREDGQLPWTLVPAAGGLDQYAPALRSLPPRLVVGEYDNPFDRYVQELEPLKGNRRVWALITHFGAAPFLETRALLDYLDEIGRRRKAIHETGVSLFLYDLTPEARSRN